jgi:predicted PurR-regulated permease PerM
VALIRRRTVLAVLLILVGGLAAVILSQVLATVFFAITVAYVLLPLQRLLVGQGIHRRIAAAVSTAVAFLSSVVLVAPVAVVLYLRRETLIDLIESVPQEIPLTVLNYSYVVDVSVVVNTVQSWVVSSAVEAARAAPVIALKVFLFGFLVYAIVLQPARVNAAVHGIVPSSYHDVVMSMHRRVRDTLYAIYVLQAATAFGTFLIAFAVFAILGYDGAFALAVVAGVLQFVPVIGPSVVVIAIAATEVVAGDVTGAILVLVAGLTLVGFLPDALIRPRLAAMTAEMPGSLYFVGFTGGVLSLGLVGFIAGPLVVGVLVEAVNLLSTERASRQTTLAETERRTSVPVPNPPPVDGESADPVAPETTGDERAEAGENGTGRDDGRTGEDANRTRDDGRTGEDANRTRDDGTAGTTDS